MRITRGRGVLAGVSRWMSEHGAWTITIDDRELAAPIPAWLLDWAGDGLISGLEEAALPRSWRRGARPVVYVRGHGASDILPGVYPVVGCTWPAPSTVIACGCSSTGSKSDPWTGPGRSSRAISTW